MPGLKLGRSFFPANDTGLRNLENSPGSTCHQKRTPRPPQCENPTARQDLVFDRRPHTTGPTPEKACQECTPREFPQTLGAASGNAPRSKPMYLNEVHPTRKTVPRKPVHPKARCPPKKYPGTKERRYGARRRSAPRLKEASLRCTPKERPQIERSVTTVHPEGAPPD